VGRDTSGAAMSNSNSAQNLSRQYGANANTVGSILTPTLNRMATNPQGFSPRTIANMNTAALQSIGGAQAGTVGLANLEAARTNNAGAFAPAVAQAGRDAMAQFSDAALGVQNRNALLQEQQRQQGLAGLADLYHTNVGAGENALGLSNNALAVKNQADANTLSEWMTPVQTILAAGGKQNTGLRYGI